MITKRTMLLCLALCSCATQKEAQQVAVAAPPPSLSHYLEIDTARLARGAAEGQWSVSGLVERHFAVEGLVRPGKKEEDAQVLLADLPTPGYALRARITPRPEQFCHLEIDLIDTRDGKHADRAPWWAIHALEVVQRGIDTLQQPRRPQMDDARFAKLHAEAAELAKSGQDPPLSLDDYVRVPMRLESQAPTDYYAPPPSATGAPSELRAPTQR